MTKSHASASKGSMRLPHTGAVPVTKTGRAEKAPTSVFITMALDMSWRLAIAILVPIIGGVELDKLWHTSPSLTIIGFIIAMVGMGLVLWQTLQVANQQPVPKLTAAQKRAIKKSYQEDDD